MQPVRALQSTGKSKACFTWHYAFVKNSLPSDTYKKFDAYESNGQSALLQEVKKFLQERYPKTDISGDGQVVVIEFSRYTVELVPGFKQADGRFKYPDTNNGGSWKYTDPLPEQDTCQESDNNSNGIYFDFCHILRKLSLIHI